MSTIRDRDIAMLAKILDSVDLPMDAENAFTRMLSHLKTHPRRDLSDTQRAWVRDVYEKHELDCDEVTNDVSSGRVPAPKEAYELPAIAGPKVLSPPSRRRTW